MARARTAIESVVGAEGADAMAAPPVASAVSAARAPVVAPAALARRGGGGRRGGARALLAAGAGLLGIALVLVAALPARAQTDEERAERLLKEGDGLLKQGRYFAASEKYSAAIEANWRCGWKKIAYGHALFALGHYAYASFNFRRGVRYMEYPKDLDFALEGLFPNKQAVDLGVKDLKRYLGQYPGDYHALTVLAHVSFFRGERGEARSAVAELLKQNASDPYALYLQERLGAPVRVEPPVAPPPPPARAVAGLDVDLPEGLSSGPQAPLSTEPSRPAVARP